MRIGVVSDSHRGLYMLDKALARMKDVEMFIHLGDHCYDMEKLSTKYKQPCETVAGNNDFVSDPVYDKTIMLGGRRLFITHGHRYGGDRLYYKGLEEEADIVLYGHTHRQSLIREGNILLLNPGSTSQPRDSKPGCALITIDEKGEIQVELIRLNT